LREAFEEQGRIEALGPAEGAGKQGGGGVEEGPPPAGAPPAGGGKAPGVKKGKDFFQENPDKVRNKKKIQRGIPESPAIEGPSRDAWPWKGAEQENARGGGQDHARREKGRTAREEKFGERENGGEEENSEPGGR